MEFTRYNHSYNHCLKEGCEHKDCILYLAYLEAQQLGLENIKLISHCDNEELSYVPVTISIKSE